MSDENSDDADEQDKYNRSPDGELEVGTGSGVEESDGSGTASDDDDDSTWISWFINLKGNDFFCEVDEEFIQDDFNLTGLQALVPYYDYALDFVLDIDIPLGTSWETFLFNYFFFTILNY